MIASIFSSLIYSKRRTLVEVFSPSLRKIWKEWDLRVMVLLSLTIQIVLIIMSNRRKYTHKLWFRIVVWCAYLAADSVATFSLGILSNNLRDLYDLNARYTLDANTELTAFWAPFLLLHLGGPDTITAYAIEDNDLWLRHFLGLVVQTGITIHVFLMAWTSSRLSIMSTLMFFAGLIKYGERTWALLSATNEKLREKYKGFSVAYNRDRVKMRFNEERRQKKEEGYVVRAETTNPHEFRVDLSVLNDCNISEENQLLAAYTLQEVIINIFLDSILSFSIGEKTSFVFRSMSFENAFQVVEMELGLIYDLLYTKASLLFTPCGLALRLVTFILTSIVLVLFSFLDDKHKYSKVDISITFVLLVGAVILEIYSAFLVFTSDRFVAWFKIHNKISTLQISSCFPLISRSPRWSNKMPQYSILSISMKEKPLPFHNILKLLKLHEYLEKGWYVAYQNVPQDFKSLIFQHFKDKVSVAASTGETVSSNAREAEAGYGTPKFEQDPIKSIFFWHIVTEVSYHLDKDQQKDTNPQFDFANYEWINQISRYMLYLSVMHPSMLSVGITDIGFQELVNAVAERLTKGTKDKIEACKKLVKKYYPSSEGVVDKAVVYIRRIADEEKDLKEKWEKLGVTWLEMFAYIAGKCKGREHAQQLRRGGELLTHVWLLMAHFGLTDHFPMSEKNRQILRLIAK